MHGFKIFPTLHPDGHLPNCLNSRIERNFYVLGHEVTAVPLCFCDQNPVNRIVMDFRQCNGSDGRFSRDRQLPHTKIKFQQIPNKTMREMDSLHKHSRNSGHD